MARQVLPIVGAAIGAYFGGPQGAQIGYMIGSVVGNAVDPLVVKGPNIGDSRVQTSAEVFRPIYFGTACGAGNIIMAGPDVKRTFEHDQGKGGGPVTTEERIFKTFAIGIGDGWKGPILGISRIWENERLVYDTRPGSTMVAESAKYATQFTLYTGTETQMPDDALEAIPEQFGGGVGNVPAFRGLAYIVFRQKDITPWMSIPQYRFEVVTDGSATPPVQLIAIKETADIGDSFWLASADGLDFSSTWQASEVLYQRDQWLITTNDKYIAYNRNFTPALIRIGESDWSVSAGDPVTGTGGYKFAAVDAENLGIVIPGGGNDVVVSDDGGESWAVIPATGLFLEMCCHLGGVFVAINRSGEVYTSVTGVGWSLANNVFADFRFSSGGSRGYSRTQSIFGGHTPGVTYYPAVAYTISSPLAWEVQHLGGGGANTFVSAIVASQEIEASVLNTYLAFASDGKIWRKVGDIAGFSIVDETLPFFPRAACHNGERFYVIGDTDDEARTGYIVSSTTGEAGTWVVERTESIASTESWIAIAALSITAGTVTGGPIRLDESVERIHELSGQSLTKVDASDLATKQLGGFILSGDYTGQAAIGMLGSIFMFDSPEYDKQIHHRFRGKPVVRTITDDDLVDEPDDGTREDQIEFPRKLHLEAQNTASGYAPAKETSERESSDVRVVGELSVSAPLMFAGDAEQQASEQARTANILHKVAWEKARGKREIVVPDKYLTDVPGDAYMVNIRGRSDRMTIDRQNYVDGVLRLELSYDRASAYVSNRSGNTPSEQTPPPSTIVGATGMMVLDISALRDEDDINSAVRYVALGPLTPSWYGSEFGESLGGGSSYYRRMRRNSPGAVMGTLQADVAEASEHYTDRTNKVRVQLDLASYSERIEALTEQQFLSEGGAFALVNASDETEICQYMEVDDLGNGLLELSVLLRGRGNSGTFAFPAGSRFVLLSTTRPVTSQSSYIGREIWHRAVSFDSTGETATVSQMDFQGNSQREWPVAHLLLERAGDVVTATAVPRHRFGTDVAPVQSTNHIGYRWTATDGVNTASGDTNSVTPSRAFNVTGWASPITVTVAQINRITGAGPTVSEEIA